MHRQPAVRRPQHFPKRKAELSLEHPVGADHRQMPLRPPLGDQMTERGVEIAERRALADARPVRWIGDDPSGAIVVRQVATACRARTPRRPRHPPARRSPSTAVIAPASRSVPTSGTVAPGSSCAAARARAAGHVASAIPGQASAANRRARPGAIRRAINAASMMIVPEPHIGSSSGSVWRPSGRKQQRGSESLAHRRLGDRLPPPATMEQPARGIGRERHLVAMHPHHDPQHRRHLRHVVFERLGRRRRTDRASVPTPPRRRLRSRRSAMPSSW